MSTIPAAAKTPSPTNGHAGRVSGGGGGGDRCFNFGAGPSVLPEEVIRQIQEDLWNYKG